MRTIVFFNDNSAEAENAAEFSFRLAQRVGADILILNLVGQNQMVKAVSEKHAAINKPAALSTTPIFDHLIEMPLIGDYRPVISDVDASEMKTQDITSLITEKNIWLMVKGIEQGHITHEHLTDINVQAILNRVACPLMLIPYQYKKIDFRNITYTVDMRYCRTPVLKFLAEMANIYQANLVIEHFSATGLTPLDDQYALSLFDSEITRKIKCEKLFFNNIKEKNIDVALDVMINGLHTDLLAVVNHRSHFEEIFGLSIKDALPESLPVPVIIFPL